MADPGCEDTWIQRLSYSSLHCIWGSPLRHNVTAILNPSFPSTWHSTLLRTFMSHPVLSSKILMVLCSFLSIVEQGRLRRAGVWVSTSQTFLCMGSPGDLVKSQVIRFCISNKFPGDVRCCWSMDHSLSSKCGAACDLLGRKNFPQPSTLCLGLKIKLTD